MPENWRMDTTKILVCFTCGTLLGVVLYAGYAAFGPGSAYLKDPFEEHED